MSAEQMNEQVNFANYQAAVKDMINGDDPPNIKEKCLQLCQTYLAGSWLKLSVKDIEVRRMPGGIGSLLYVCSAGDQSVIVRIHGRYYDAITTTTFNSALIASILGEKGVGPEVFGAFEEGMIMKNYQCRNFTEDDLYDPELRDQLAHKLAMLHCSKMPVEKSVYFLDKYDYFSKKLTPEYITNEKARYRLNGCQSLLALDLKSEWVWMRNTVHWFESPVVFAHIDCRFGNTLVTEDRRLMLCDFDTCAHNYRGFDFSALFMPFCEPNVKAHRLKDEKVVRHFIKSYLDKCHEIMGDEFLNDPVNTVEHVFNELQQMILVYSQFLMMCYLFEEITRNVPMDEKTILNMVESVVVRYNATKQDLIERGLLPCYKEINNNL